MEFNVNWHDKLDSTNACMRDHFSRGCILNTGDIIAAREQTAGRGRQNRVWLTAPDTNLCFSLFIETDAELMAVPSLTMAVALAITEMLNEAGIPASPKWPNDVLVDGKKICGILSERVDSASQPKPGIIVGIGLNVNMAAAEAEAIDRPATSMLIESGLSRALPETLESLFHPLERWVQQWERGGFPAFKAIWTEKAGPIGKPLTVHDGDSVKSGTLAGFGPYGELWLNTDNGIETIWSGDVS